MTASEIEPATAPADEQADEDLVEYEEEPEGQEELQEEPQGQEVKGSYAGASTASFQDMLLKTELMSAIRDAGFEHPSEVQHSAIPAAMTGTDVICQALSGMGKTAVFVLATLQQIDPKDGEVDTLVLVHTRELAFQIAAEFTRFAKYLKATNGVKIGVVYGGVPFDDNNRMIDKEKPHVLIGTPGRLMHLVREKVANLEKVQRFIMDECDNMLLEIGMRRQLQEVFKATPKTKQVMLFSATISDEVKKLCCKFTKNAEEYYVKLSEAEKNRKLNDLLDALEFNQVVIFVKSRQRASQLNTLLRKCAFPSECVHGGMSQTERLNIYQKFKNFKCRILVSTDLFGRGVDIEKVNIVINYDMPDDSDKYLHRVGRAGRFGTKGLGVSFISSTEEQTILDQIQSRFEVKVEPLPNEVDTNTYL